MTAEEIKKAVMSVKDAEGYSNAKAFILPIGTRVKTRYNNDCEEVYNIVLAKEVPVRLNHLDEREGVTYYYNYVTIFTNKEQTESKTSYKSFQLSWDWIVKQPEVLEAVKTWLEKVTPRFDTVKEGGIIKFTNQKTNEQLLCDLGRQKFTRTYKKGKPREITYPTQYFKYVSGRLLIDGLQDESYSNFSTLVNQVAENYYRCKNFGTFLVRMFDHIHLEQYIAAKVPYTFGTPFAYSDFDKDMRNKLNEHKVTYNENVGALFCSDKNTGRALFSLIKDKKGFKNMLNILSANIQPLNTLVNHYNYDLKTLYSYCDDRHWKSGSVNYRVSYGMVEGNPAENEQTVSAYNYSVITFLRDYARMSRQVYGDNFIKYPENLREAHDEVTRLHREKKVDEATAKSFEEVIDLSLEWKGKDFIVVHPKTADEVTLEGQKLRHCVGSYIGSVVNGECQIVFLRYKDNPEKPFVTIELQGGNIRQARGFGNSVPRYDAKVALKEYAKAKKFMYIT